MRRKAGTIIPIEVAILQAAVGLRADGEGSFHGYRIAKAVRDQDGARQLTAHGTLYKALDRMQRAGLLRSRWEAPEIAEGEGRPRRRLYTVTPEGARALEAALAAAEQAAGDAAGGWQPV